MKDPILELLVKFSETSSGLETPITLLTGGILVSGFVINKDKYMEHNALITKIQEGIQKALDEAKNSGVEAPTPSRRKYIHLRDAQYFVPGQLPTPANQTTYCRVKLSAIDGYSFGILPTTERVN